MKKILIAIFYLLSLTYLSAMPTMSSPIYDADEMPKQFIRITTKPSKQATTPHRSTTSTIDAYYEAESIYVSAWGDGELERIEVYNNTNGNHIDTPANGCYAVVEIEDMGCGDYTLLIYCNDTLFVGTFTI